MNNDIFIDEYGFDHARSEVLGQGGQGVVFRTDDPDLAIKLVTDAYGEPLTDPVQIQRYQRRFQWVRLLPLPDGVNISMPIALLKNKAGYVMPLLGEMEPFEYFWPYTAALQGISDDAIPHWMAAMQPADAKKLVHYQRTGGLRRRLNALLQSASLLARLHGYGLVYGDISPGNMFISRGAAAAGDAVWLIDADNLRFDRPSCGSAIYTPRYGAPELVNQRDGGRPASDCHAFAVVAFYLLSTVHPFMGRQALGEDRDWSDTDDDARTSEDRALAGELPWVGDEEDDSNATDSGLPTVLVLTPALQTLFNDTFSAGRLAPWRRPAIWHWPQALAAAADITLECAGCSMNYYPETPYTKTCPYCQAPLPARLVLESWCWEGADAPLGEPDWRFCREITPGAEITLPRRVVDDFAVRTADDDALVFCFDGPRLTVKKIVGATMTLAAATDGAFHPVSAQLGIEYADAASGFWLFTEMTTPRLIRCVMQEAGQ